MRLSLTVLLLVLLFGTRARAQNGVLEVVSKTIADTYDYRSGSELAVEGEKAEIFVETWSQQKISVRVVLTARHPRLEQARRDLENLEFITEVAGQKIFLKNRRKDENRKPESELTVEYHIILPEECPVYLKSHFGGATISNLRNRLRINGEFSAINIDNVQGLLDIRTRFGDIVGEKIDGNVVINARRSDISLLDVGGTFTINAQYGELKLSPNIRMRDLRINADKSNVYIYEPVGGEGLAYELSSNNGELRVPDNRQLIELDRTNEWRRVQIGPNTERSGTITASVTFGNLTLGKQR
ncbi:hypothetical protein GGR26_003440 [Lewinella marina]|uniref:Adhesin domain-containing protein n=1 Tax=Neolewinella marina TaxID=438751 RepID=A0A2G0CCI6_9BACT|nr:hypothetical protein [Neolewinella marina]NJB87656.1 hypothetical protein [Neolewinella marina]PHK97660.1 hypothetical protein CGL56_14610 [Neolewinella marina]